MNLDFKQIQWSLMFILFALPFALIAAEKTPEWQLETDKSGVQILTRETPSGYKEVKATITIRALPADFLNLLENVALAPKWIANCHKVELLDKHNEFERIVKSTFSAPWPVKDRVMFTHSITSIDPNNGSVSIDISDVSDRYPADSGKVTMLNVRGQWRLEKLTNDMMSVTYLGYGEPAGNLPRWLSNKLVVSSIYTTFNNMRLMLE